MKSKYSTVILRFCNFYGSSFMSAEKKWGINKSTKRAKHRIECESHRTVQAELWGNIKIKETKRFEWNINKRTIECSGGKLSHVHSWREPPMGRISPLGFLLFLECTDYITTWSFKKINHAVKLILMMLILTWSKRKHEMHR